MPNRFLRLLVLATLMAGWTDFGVHADDPKSPDTSAAQEPTNDNAAAASKQWTREGWPLLQQFCVDCHNQDFQEGELDLSGFASIGTESVGEAGGQMKRVLEMVRFGAMPPEDYDQPTPEERKKLVTLLDQTLYAVSCDLRPRPGKVTARRLNRAEYDRSIRDLFGMDLRAAEAFPSDEVGAGFDNNGDVLSLSPLLMEKYLDAAELIAGRVLVDPAELPKLNDERSSDQLLIHGDTKTGSFTGRFLAVDGFAWADFEVPVDGEYRVRVRGGTTERDTETRVAVWDESGMLKWVADLGYYGGGGSSQYTEFRLNLEKGKRTFYVEPIEDSERELVVDETVSETFAQLDPQIVKDAVERKKQRIRPDRNFDRTNFPFMVREIEVNGPSEPPRHLLPPSQQQILRKHAKRRGDRWTDVDSAALASLKPLMRRAFRGPVSDDEIAPYVQLVVDATKRGESYVRGMQIAVSAVLVSPRFLFRIESPPDDWPRDEDGSVKLTPHQFATRLSYFLWSSTPDETLLKAAEDGSLMNEKQLERIVRKMIQDPKADALGNQFAAQWLGLRNLDVHEADLSKFETFTPSLRQAMVRETTLVFMQTLRGNQPTSNLLTTKQSFMNEELAQHYGINGVSGSEFQEVSLMGTPRRGVLSHASVLTLTSNPARTSPVKRGKWILENILGTPPPEPPPGVPELEETKTAAADATLREQLELHRANPSCASCHRVMDQLGFGLEQFDAIGRYRELDGTQAVDASGELPGGRTFNGAAELSDMLGKTEAEAFAKTYTERVMTFALGRELTPQDRCVVDEIMGRTAGKDHQMVDVILEVIRSRPFQYYDWVDPNPSKPIDAE